MKSVRVTYKPNDYSPPRKLNEPTLPFVDVVVHRRADLSTPTAPRLEFNRLSHQGTELWDGRGVEVVCGPKTSRGSSTPTGTNPLFLRIHALVAVPPPRPVGQSPE